MDWTPEAIIEELRNWEDKFYSESETKLLMEKAAQLIEQQRKYLMSHKEKR